MWKRMLLMLLLLTLGVTAFAAPSIGTQFPSIFKPAANDLSIWYLGNIFGSDLIPGENVPAQMLLSRLFNIFNQVALAVGIIILIYYIVGGTLLSAAEGKPMGEKWSSLWIPVRIAGGIGMLIPKAGSGYCMAQYIVAWLVIQGIGAADNVWSTMLDYFKAGGAIYTQQAPPQTPTVYSYDNMNYTYSLQSTAAIGGGSYGKNSNESVSLMQNLVCMQQYNIDPARQLEETPAQYRMYVKNVVMGKSPATLIIFGDQQHYKYTPPQGNGDSVQDLKEMQGAECGVIRIRPTSSNKKQTQQAVQNGRIVQVYSLALQRTADSLNRVGLIKDIAAESSDIRWDRYFLPVNIATQTYINNISQYYSTLYPEGASSTAASQRSGAVTKSLDTFKEYGWILAGNYYTYLSHLEAKNMEAIPTTEFVTPSQANMTIDYVPNGSDNHETDKQIQAFFSAFKADPAAMYTAPDSEYVQDQKAAVASKSGKSSGKVSSPLKNEQMQEIQKAVGSTNSDQLTGVTADRVKEFIKYLSGDQKGALVSQDPILAASKYGKTLTEAAIALMITFGSAMMISAFAAATCTGQLPFWHALNAFFAVLSPMMLALGAFMYAEGAVLGIFIPVIPYLNFLTGVVGLTLQIVEAMAAAPLVAVGLIFPGTKEDIWGRASPALMLTLNLFLRPSLMIVGFAAAMIVTWVLVELLNIGFLTMVSGTFRIENMWGFVTIMMAYTAIFTYVISEAYSLINVVPNKVLHWIGGDQSMSVKGAEEATGAAKQGAEQGGRSVAAGAAFGQKADLYRSSASAKKAFGGSDGGAEGGAKKGEEP